jgi:hypothetical protein
MLARCPGRAGVLSSFELGQPSLGLGRLLQGADGDDQIHDVVGLAGREDALRAIREERAPRLDQIAGAGAFRQLKRDRVVAFRRQQAADAKTQRHPVAGQGLGDERARERLARLLKQGLKRKGFPVAGPFRAAPRPATQGTRLRPTPGARLRSRILIRSSRWSRSGCARIGCAAGEGNDPQQRNGSALRPHTRRIANHPSIYSSIVNTYAVNTSRHG